MEEFHNGQGCDDIRGAGASRVAFQTDDDHGHHDDDAGGWSVMLSSSGKGSTDDVASSHYSRLLSV